MNDEQITKAENDAAVGQRYKSMWNDLLEPFFTAKQYELFEMFQNVSSTDTDMLVAVRMQSNALTSLRDEISSFIETGKMAQQQLLDEDINNG